MQYGAQAILEREYGPYIVSPENGYDFSVQVDLENLPEDKGVPVLSRHNLPRYSLRLQRARMI